MERQLKRENLRNILFLFAHYGIGLTLSIIAIVVPIKVLLEDHVVIALPTSGVIAIIERPLLPSEKAVLIMLIGVGVAWLSFLLFGKIVRREKKF